MDQIYELWDDLSAFPPAETEQRLAHLAKGIAKLFHADNVRWLAAVRVLNGAEARRDRLLGWRLRASYNLKSHRKPLMARLRSRATYNQRQ